VIHLDSHVAVWIDAGRSRLSSTARRLIASGPCYISPMAVMEIEILFEIGRLAQAADEVVAGVRRQIDLTVSDVPFARVVETARGFAWTRDPFDRLIVANAMADGARLLTADTTILANFKDAVW
jgi:PIN domain nuclease of toxin-antitoxin system